MALYMYQGSCTAESVAAQIREPHEPRRGGPGG